MRVSRGKDSSKVVGRVWPDSTNKAGHVISWDNGQVWVRETQKIEVTGVQVQRIEVNLNPITRHEEELAALAKAGNGEQDQPQKGQGQQGHDHKGKGGGKVDGEAAAEEKDNEEPSQGSSEEDEAKSEEDDVQWRNYAHAAATHNAAVLEHMNRNSLFGWRIIDISHISPFQNYEELFLPKLNTALVKERVSSWAHRLSVFILEHVQPEEEEESEEQIRNLKDLNFDTCAAADLSAFFQDKTFSRDVVTMLQVYLEISCSSLAEKRDNLQDEMQLHTLALRNTAYYREQIEEIDSKLNSLHSVRRMLHFDAWSLGFPRTSRIRILLVDLAAHRGFRSFIFFMIVANCGLLALDSPPRVGLERFVLDFVQLPIYGSFVLEMIILVVGHGPRSYWRDPWNRLDSIIVLGSIADLATYYSPLRSSDGSSANEGESFSLLVVLTGLRT